MSLPLALRQALWPAAGLACAAMLAMTPVFRTLDRAWLDTCLRWLAEERPATATAVVDIDEASMQTLRQSAGPWPYRRDVHATVARRLLGAGAHAVVFNLSLADAREGDEALRQLARQQPGRVVLGGDMRGSDSIAGGAAATPATALPPHAETASPTARVVGAWPGASDLPAPRWVAWQPPAAGLLDDASRIGVLQTRLDDDGLLRCLHLLHRVDGQLVPSLALAAATAGEPVPSLQAAPDGGLQAGAHRWPADERGCIALRLPRRADSMPVLSFAEVVQAMPETSTPPPWADQVRGRTVFIGSPSLLDGRALTPLGQVGGTLWHAMAHEALVSRQLLKPRSLPLDVTLAVLAALPLAGALRQRPLPWSREAALSLAVLLAVLLSSLALLWGLAQPSALPLALLLLACGLLTLFARRQHWLSGLRLQAQLEQARAQAASRARTEFLAHMSHEIRTPLNAALGVAQLLAETPLTPLQQRYVEVFNRSGAHLRQLVDDVLDITRIEAGNLPLRIEPFSLPQLLQEVGSLFESRAQAQGLQFEIGSADDLPTWVQGDRRRLQQVLVNLLGNACKFTEAGSVSLQVRRDGTPDGIEFCVQDTGIGVPAAQRERIFEPFAQADDTVSRRFGGSGLGLAITQRLVSAMRGRVSLDSEEGRGTTVTLCLPLPAWDGPPPEARPVSPPGTAAVLKGCRVLLAEDNDYNVLVVEGMLQGTGAQVQRAADGRQAVELASSGSHDLILMDLQMPHLDGHAATRAIREAERLAGRAPVPIIALSANALAADVEASRLAGCNAHLGKPFDKAELLHTMVVQHAGAAARRVDGPTGSAALDRQEALQRFGGDALLYERVLAAARAQWRDWPARYTLGRQDPDAQLPRRLAHDLKSTAATVGAHRLSKAASQLEACLREGGDTADAERAVDEAVRELLEGGG